MENSFYYCPGFFLIISIFFLIRCIIFQKKMFKYLCKTHTDKWDELTTLFGFGPGLANGLKTIKFLFSSEYYNDPEVLRLKVIVRNAFLYIILGFITTFVAFFIVVGLRAK